MTAIPTTEKDLVLARNKRNNIAYIIEAALEYFISLLITDSFLAVLLTANGVSDAAIGIITQLSSLTFTARLVSVFVRIRKGRVKTCVTLLHLLNELFFVLMYLSPVFRFSSGTKVALIVLFFIGGHILSNIVFPYKQSWMMSFVDNRERGKFTANKEIVSLIGGMIFTFTMGAFLDVCYGKKTEPAMFVDKWIFGIVDKLTETFGLEKLQLGFLIGGFTILVIALLHLCSVVAVKDNIETPEEKDTRNVSFKDTIKAVVANKTLLKIYGIDIIWHAATGISVSFYGSYKMNDLGFTLGFTAVLFVMYSVTRSLVSRFFGKMADKKSWTYMLSICFGIAALAYFVNIFTVPSNGKVMFTLYYCIYAVSMAGINSGLLNVIFDYTDPGDIAAALGVKYAVGGLVAFGASLVGSAILSAVQKNGNTVFGIHMYAQQLLTVIAFVLCLVLIVYMRKVISKLKTK